MNNNCQIYFTFSVQNTVITGKKCDTKEPEVKHLLSLDTCDAVWQKFKRSMNGVISIYSFNHVATGLNSC